jgi:hypothetical protein
VAAVRFLQNVQDLHSATSQKAALFIVIAVKILNLTYYNDDQMKENEMGTRVEFTG